MERSDRIGMWNEAVSRVQSTRKKIYCSKIGCAASRLEDEVEMFGVMDVEFHGVLALVPLSAGGKGGGGDVGSGGDDGVAFSIRAQVR